jgi:hypothetical protein
MLNGAVLCAAAEAPDQIPDWILEHCNFFRSKFSYLKQKEQKYRSRIICETPSPDLVLSGDLLAVASPSLSCRTREKHGRHLWQVALPSSVWKFLWTFGQQYTKKSCNHKTIGSSGKTKFENILETVSHSKALR